MLLPSLASFPRSPGGPPVKKKGAEPVSQRLCRMKKPGESRFRRATLPLLVDTPFVSVDYPYRTLRARYFMKDTSLVSQGNAAIWGYSPAGSPCPIIKGMPIY
jgi:hypothetical protein